MAKFDPGRPRKRGSDTRATNMGRDRAGAAAARRNQLPTVIGVHGARHNNLHNVDVDVPLWRTVAVVGVSGSGKTSLAIGTLYAEGMQRFLKGLSTYSRRRLTQAQRPDVDHIDHLPPALALRQRPPIPGPRSTVGTMSDVLNVLRLMMSRLGSHMCPNGHRIGPSIASLAEEMTCPVCGARFEHPSAESFSFNSYGACPACQGLGVRSEVDIATLVLDPGKTIEEGAVLPWNSGGGSSRNGRTVHLSVNYDNAVAAVERSLRGDNERTRGQVQRFLVTRVCSVCNGARLRPEALNSLLGGRNLAQISGLGLDALRDFAAGLPAHLPTELNRLTTGLLAELDGTFVPLLHVGLGYLTLDRPGASLSTGELQRIELTSTVRASTTGIALRAGRAVGRPPPDQRPGVARDHHGIGRQWQHRDRGRARARAHHGRRLGHRTRSGRRRQRRPGDSPGHPPNWKPTRARSLARSWPAPVPCLANVARRPIPAATSRSRSASCTTSTTSPPRFR